MKKSDGPFFANAFFKISIQEKNYAPYDHWTITSKQAKQTGQKFQPELKNDQLS